jgi:serine/threonine-protein kinase RsbW
MPAPEHPFAPADEVFQGEIPSRSKEREALVERVLAQLEAAGCEIDPFFDRLAIDEAIANAILHGNREDPRKKVSVRVFIRPDRWGVEVRDQGAGFAWQERFEAARNPPLSGPSGRGLALLRASGAEIHFLDGGRCVVIARQRKPGWKPSS